MNPKSLNRLKFPLAKELIRGKPKHISRRGYIDVDSIG